jgi:hypothetical protein
MVNPLRPFRAAITRNATVPDTTEDIREADTIRTVVDKDLLRGDPGREARASWDAARPSDPLKTRPPAGADDLAAPASEPRRVMAASGGDDDLIDRDRFRGATLLHDVRGNPETPNVNDIVQTVEAVKTRTGSGRADLVKVTSPETWTVVRRMGRGVSRFGEEGTVRRFRFSTRTGEVRSPDIDPEPARRRFEAWESDPEVDERRLNELVGPTIGTTGALLAQQDGDSRLGAIARKLTSR